MIQLKVKTLELSELLRQGRNPDCLSSSTWISVIRKKEIIITYSYVTEHFWVSFASISGLNLAVITLTGTSTENSNCLGALRNSHGIWPFSIKIWLQKISSHGGNIFLLSMRSSLKLLSFSNANPGQILILISNQVSI